MNNPILDKRKKKPTMLIKFSSDNYVLKLLGTGKEHKDVADYNQLTFKKSISFSYREASK